MSFGFQIFIYKVVLTVTWQKALRTAHIGPQGRSKHGGTKLGGEIELIWERDCFFVVSAFKMEEFITCRSWYQWAIELADQVFSHFPHPLLPALTNAKFSQHLHFLNETTHKGRFKKTFRQKLPGCLSIASYAHWRENAKAIWNVQAFSSEKRGKSKAEVQGKLCWRSNGF